MAISGTFSATGLSAAESIRGANRLSLYDPAGTWSGTVKLERQRPDGAWGTVQTYTGPVEEIVEEADARVPYRFQCTARTTGTLAYSLTSASQ